MLRACALIKIKENLCPWLCLEQAVKNVKPLIELSGKDSRKNLRKKSKPIPVSPRRATKVALQWIIEGAEKIQGHSMALRLCTAILNANQKKGYAIKKKIDLHNLCKTSYFQSKLKIKNI